MKWYQFQQIWEVILHMWATPQSKEDNDWWMISLAVDKFNVNCQCHMRASLIKTMDESMSAFHLQTWSTGNLPHLSFIMQKPKDLGTEFKFVTCPMTGILLHLEIQKGHDVMRQAAYSAELGGTTGCIVCLVKKSKCKNDNADQA